MKLIYKLLTAFFLLLSNGINAETYNILDFGAKTDGITLNTKAINNAVNKCFENGGGTVLVPAGTFVTGTIVLKSNVNLHLEAGAILLGSENLLDYSKSKGIIFCEDAFNVSISGKGVIQAQGIKFYETDKNHTYEEFDKNRTRQKQNYMPEGTFFTDGPLKRKPKPG